MTDSATQHGPDAAPAKARSYYLYLSACAVAACIIVRAPSIFDEGKVPLIDLKLKLNAGWILTLGPLAIVLAISAIAYLNRDVTRPRISERPFTSVAVRAIPCLGAAFLSLQFFLLFAPKGQCNTYPRWMFLTDWRSGAFQPEYCMSLSAETQERMPYLINPPALQAWAQVILPLIAICIVVADWRFVHRQTLPSDSVVLRSE